MAKMPDKIDDDVVLHLSMFPKEPYLSVNNERLRAIEKHGDNNMESLSPYDYGWWSVVMEEIGEVALAINDKDSIEHMREELVQVAAMVCAWIDSCTREIEQHG